MFTSMQSAVCYFSVFGGSDISVNKDLPISHQIEKYILDKYSYIRRDISHINKGDSATNMFLSILAIGDGKVLPAIKKAKLSFDDAIDTIEMQCDNEILIHENPRSSIFGLKSDSDVSSKVTFTTPFIRFWFAFVSPLYKGIRDNNYIEFHNKYKENASKLEAIIFKELSCELFKMNLKDKRIVSIGKYWDRDISIDMVAKTKDGMVIIGSSLYSNNKTKKNELNRLKKIAKSFNIDIDTIIIFSKKGFDNELKSLRGEGLHLFNMASFDTLLD
jgi:hypothetical protein